MNKCALGAEKILAEALPHGIVVIDAKGWIQWSNKTIDGLLQLSADKTYNIYHLFVEPEFKDFLQNEHKESIELYAPHYPNMRLSISRRPYLHNQLLIIQDITHRYRLETMRQDFIANVSHELRTPLTVFRGYLEILADQPALSVAERQEILRQMTEQDERMERLVTDLLLLSHLESDDPNIKKHEKVDVAALIQAIYRDAKAMSVTHTIHLQLDAELMLLGEPHELHSAFSNLIVNAMRYTPAGGKISIRWYRRKNMAYFEVSDTGIGIAPKHIDRITQRFYRVDKARSREHGGTGLGLAIVKHVLLRHGGDLVIESILNKGSTFRCSFPLS